MSFCYEAEPKVVTTWENATLESRRRYSTSPASSIGKYERLSHDWFKLCIWLVCDISPSIIAQSKAYQNTFFACVSVNMFSDLKYLSLCLSFSPKQQEQLRQDNSSFIKTSTGKVPSINNSRPTSTVTGAATTGAATTAAATTGTVRSSSSDSGFVSTNKGTSESSLSRMETSSGPSGKQKRDFGGASGTQAAGETCSIEVLLTDLIGWLC